MSCNIDPSNPYNINSSHATYSKLKTFAANATGAVVQTAALATFAPWSLCFAKFAYSWLRLPVGALTSVFVIGLVQAPTEDNTSTKIRKAIGTVISVCEKASNFLRGNSSEPRYAENHSNVDLLIEKAAKMWTATKQEAKDIEKGFYRLAGDFGGTKKAILFGVAAGTLHLFYKHMTTVHPDEQPATNTPFEYFLNEIASYSSYQIAGATAGLIGLCEKPKLNQV